MIVLKKVQINIRLNEETKERLQEKADAFGVSISEYIRILIINDLKGENDGKRN